MSEDPKQRRPWSPSQLTSLRGIYLAVATLVIVIGLLIHWLTR